MQIDQNSFTMGAVLIDCPYLIMKHIVSVTFIVLLLIIAIQFTTGIVKNKNSEYSVSLVVADKYYSPYNKTVSHEYPEGESNFTVQLAPNKVTRIYPEVYGVIFYSKHGKLIISLDKDEYNEIDIKEKFNVVYERYYYSGHCIIEYIENNRTGRLLNKWYSRRGGKDEKNDNVISDTNAS